MTIGIVTDTTCDIPATLVAEHNIVVVPAYVNMGEESYLDGVELSREEFYTRLPGCNPPPTTAAPSPGQFQQAYEQLAARGVTEILSIHLSSTLSNLYAAAQMAAQAIENVKVLAIDARQASMGLGFTVLAAARAAAAGRTLPDVAEMLKGLIQRTHLVAVIDTLEFLRRSGRLNSLQAGLGSLLQVKPIVKLHDGVILTERVRTRGQAMQRLLALLHERLPVENLAVMHVRARDRAEELLAEVRHLLPAGEIPIIEAAPAIAVHVGPGALGFVSVSAEQ
ncbi:MAG: DegV family protein [Anaerolineales bacterium]|nr:DegV family protein [Anaerolineales bacterium]